MPYFEKSELESWLRQNPVKPQMQIARAAQEYVMSNQPLKKQAMAEQAINREIVILWQASRLTLTGEYVVVPEILRIHGSAIGTPGNFSVSVGKAKSKKTFNVSAIVAATLKNGIVLQYAAELPENKRKILYVDTEQSPCHCQKVMRHIVRMAGLSMDREPKNLDFLLLRRHTPEIRIAIVEEAIYHTEGLGLVVIDDIRDMVYDINSPSESTKHVLACINSVFFLIE